MTSTSKHQPPLKKVNITDGEDRISRLPNSLRIHILSFLPTIDAVRTSILSSEWKNLWAYVPNLEFDEGMLSPSNTSPRGISFVNFVDHVLTCHRLPCIKKFSVKGSSQLDALHVHEWIRTVILRCVKEVDIDLSMNWTSILPEELFTSNTLESLRLMSGLRFHLPSLVYLPKLKFLNVNIDYPSNELTQKLFSNCPMLEDLQITASIDNDEDIIFYISTPALKSLKLDLCAFEYYEGELTLPKNLIVVDAPVLEHLTVKDDYLASYSFMNLSSLVGAYIDVGICCMEIVGTKEHAYHLLALLEGITNVKFLSLHPSTVGVLEIIDGIKLPLFRNLIHLELVVYNCCTWRRLSDLLCSAPYLVTLELCRVSEHEDPHLLEDFDWVEPQRKPTELLSHLEKIEISGFVGQSGDLKVLKFLLENARVLNKVIVDCEELIDKCEELTLEEECMLLGNQYIIFKEASKTCQFEVIWKL